MYSNLYYTSSYLLTKKRGKTFPYFIARFILFEKYIFFLFVYTTFLCVFLTNLAHLYGNLFDRISVCREELFLNVYKRCAVYEYMVQGGSPEKDLSVWLWHMWGYFYFVEILKRISAKENFYGKSFRLNLFWCVIYS